MWDMGIYYIPSDWDWIGDGFGIALIMNIIWYVLLGSPLKTIREHLYKSIGETLGIIAFIGGPLLLLILFFLICFVLTFFAAFFLFYIIQPFLHFFGEKVTIIKVAKNFRWSSLRLPSIKRITDQRLLADIAKNDWNSDVGKAAVEKLTDQSILVDVANNGKFSDVLPWEQT